MLIIHGSTWIVTDNPADIISKETFLNKLTNNQLYWGGPQWLSISRDHWPSESAAPLVSEIEEVPETKQSAVLLAVSHSPPDLP